MSVGDGKSGCCAVVELGGGNTNLVGGGGGGDGLVGWWVGLVLAGCGWSGWSVGWEHAFGSGFDAKNTADAIKFKLLDPATNRYITTTTADRVLVSDDGVDFSYSEMTAVAGDYWSVKGGTDNVICVGKGGESKDKQRAAGDPQTARLFHAFKDMWANKDFGASGKHKLADGKPWMGPLEEQLRKMLADEKAGVEQLPANDVHRGSNYYEPKQPGWFGNVGGIIGQAIDTTFAYNARAEGDWKALEFNGQWQFAGGSVCRSVSFPALHTRSRLSGLYLTCALNCVCACSVLPFLPFPLSVPDDHFWTCAQDTYKVGHFVAMHEAYNAGHDLRIQQSKPALNRAPSDPLDFSKPAAGQGVINIAVPQNAAQSAAAPIPALVPGPQAPHPDAVNIKKATEAEVAAAAPILTPPAKRLVHAYAIDGFVSHFLSDQFSAGHLRTPRLELRTLCVDSKNAGITANVMHDEDNWNCLLVENKRNQHWWACGDHRFFDQENAMNRRMLHDAIEASVHEIQSAFTAGAAGLPAPHLAANWEAAGIKYIGAASDDGPQKLSMRQRVENICPYFKVEAGGKLSTRVNGPRPAGAMKYAWGSTLRNTMSNQMFPVFVDAKTTVPELAQTDASFLAQYNKITAADTVCEYRAAAKSDCCTLWGRATPEFSDKSQFADKPTSKYQSTAAPTDTAKRSTYKNRCALEQDVANAAKAFAKPAVAAASVAASGLKALGNAVSQVPMGFPLMPH